MKLSRFTRAGSAAVMVGALALTLAACGSDNPTGEPAAADASADAPEVEITGEYAGAGASSQKAAVAAWTAAFQSTYPDVTVNYDPAGSGAGREQFIAGAVAWAGTDSALKDEELEAAKAVCGPDGAIDIPVYISPIAVAFNLPGIKELNLSSATIAKIFTGAITTWNDPAIAAENEGVELPATAITPVHRSDKSGTTGNFTDYLNKTAGDIWTDEKNDEWQLEGGESAEGTSGVIGVVTDTEGAVTYADESGVGADLGQAAIKVGEEWVKPSAEGAANVVATSPLADGRAENDLAVSIDRTASASGDYPLLLVSYAAACTSYSDQATGDFVKAFLGYVVSEEGQQAAASAAGSAPLSGEIADKAAAAVESITVG